MRELITPSHNSAVIEAPGSETEQSLRERDELDIKPRFEDYASLPTDAAFDWDEILRLVAERRKLPATPLYLVVFRSTLKAGVDTT